MKVVPQAKAKPNFCCFSVAELDKVAFYDDIYLKSGRKKTDTIYGIRDFAMRTCDMSVAMRPVIDYIKSTNSDE